ncbi:hypothetical protein DICVIV_05787 [Dictyocaulus viviparus]|uniref:Uncharacterized protein n=1 Tax=Dictyocaulus viviparus TaxID=29172 RepID=A0A0D8XU27_DICVI|nr:hypothetical protein DICVIV_05787 [Dictyocaulus viviparus]
MNSTQSRVVSGNKYESKSRPTAQELTDSFNEFSMNKETNSRKDTTPAQVKTYENKGQSQSSKILLEPRSNAPARNTSIDTKSQPGGIIKPLFLYYCDPYLFTLPLHRYQYPRDMLETVPAAARRADGLRGWNQEFNSNYRPEGKADTPRESPARGVPVVPTSNAWARGPPTSVTSMHNTQHATPTSVSPSHAVETSAPDSMPSSTNDQVSNVRINSYFLYKGDQRYAAHMYTCC